MGPTGTNREGSLVGRTPALLVSSTPNQQLPLLGSYWALLVLHLISTLFLIKGSVCKSCIIWQPQTCPRSHRELKEPEQASQVGSQSPACALILTDCCAAPPQAPH